MMRKEDRSMKVMLMLMMAVFLIIGGCGDDDDPAGPVTTTDDFTETVAVAQAEASGYQAVALVEQIDMLSAGVGSKDNKDYLYNETKKQWEYTYEESESGYTYEWMYTVQYRDGNGNAQRESTGASSLRHTMTGTGDYSSTDGGYTLAYQYTYAYDTTVTGIQAQTRVVTGTGSTVYEYSYVGNGLNQSNTYETKWATLGNGLSVPLDGCPTGTVRFDMDPYRYDVVFNGTDTAAGTLYNAGGTEIPAGGHDYDLSCSTK